MLENCNCYIISLHCSHIPQDHMPFSGTAIRNHKRSLCYSWTYVTSWTGSCGCFQTDNTLNVYARATLSNLSEIIALLNPPVNKSKAGNMLRRRCSKIGEYNYESLLVWNEEINRKLLSYPSFQRNTLQLGRGIFFACHCVNMSVICLSPMRKLSIDAINMVMMECHGTFGSEWIISLHLMEVL